MKYIQIIWFCNILMLTIPANLWGQDSILIEDPEWSGINKVERFSWCYESPFIIRNHEDLHNNGLDSCFNFIRDPEFEDYDVIIWFVKHYPHFKTNVSLNIWWNEKENRYTFQAVRSHTEVRELNAIETIFTFRIPNIPECADTKFIITDE